MISKEVNIRTTTLTLMSLVISGLIAVPSDLDEYEGVDLLDQGFRITVSYAKGYHLKIEGPESRQEEVLTDLNLLLSKIVAIVRRSICWITLMNPHEQLIATFDHAFMTRNVEMQMVPLKIRNALISMAS